MFTTYSSDFYRYMVDDSVDIIFLLDENDKVVFVNNRIESLLGFTRDELLSQHFSLVVHDEDLEACDGIYFRDNQNSNNDFTRNIELRLKNKQNDSGFRYFSISVVNVPDGICQSLGRWKIGKTGIGKNNVRTYGVARDITHQKTLENIVNTNLHHDYLTGLPNRFLLRDRVKQKIAHAKRENGQFALMFFDLDGFKQVNDKFGHTEGDIVLQTVSMRMNACLREEDTLARIGGDEFVLLLRDIHAVSEVQTIACKLLNEISRPLIVGEHKILLTVSIGVALYPENGKTFDELINGADRAMYHIKHRSKNGCVFLSDLPETNKQGDVFSLS